MEDIANWWCNVSLSLSLSLSLVALQWLTGEQLETQTQTSAHIPQEMQKPDQLQVVKQTAKTESRRIQRAEKEYIKGTKRYTVKFN